ncbi:delphilin-like [Dorcoceras hygrometricum]|uniref:Delphilin-like n=1 Tax=Dorcoceras hygrometricum TaxID=472368 RepID=A0A2Z7AWT0_9LAMI|nr:delphilin-like [Dorcoceras hygrometricum]
MKNSLAYVSATVGRLYFKKTALLTSSSRNMFRGNSDACFSIIDEILPIKKTALLTSSSRNMFRGNSDACVSVTDEGLHTNKIALLTSLHLIVCKGNRSAYVSIADRGLHSLHSQMASSFITNSYQINFESVLMIHDNEGMLNMFKALEASGLRQFLGCESILYEAELGHFFETALLQDEDITCAISGNFITISPSLFTTVFALPSEGITNFSEVPKDIVYDARSLFSQKAGQLEVHGKKKFMKHELRLLNDILAKAITVKAGSFDSVTVKRFQMMTAIQYGLKVNWGKVLFNVLKDMVDRTQKKAKGFAAQIGVLLKSFPAIPMGDGVPFPSAKVLSMRTVHTYIVTNTTIDARTESEEPGMAKTPKGKMTHSSADEMPVDMFSEFAASKKRSATEADAPIIAKKRRTGKSKPSVSQAKLDIVKSRKRRLVLSKDSDDESVGTEEIVKEADPAVVLSTVEADIAKVLEETLALGVIETERETQVFDEALFEEDFTRWLDDFVARHNEPEMGSTHNEAQAVGSIHSVADKEVNMPIDDLLIQICDDLLLPVTAAEVTMLRLGAFSSSRDKGKAKLGEDDQVTDNAARKLFALICRDVEVLVQVRDRLMQAVVDFFASFSLNSMPDMDSLKDLKEKERPVRKDACYAITVHNLGVERIPANFLRLFAQGLACNNFVDSVCQKDLGDTEEVALTGVEEVYLVSSDVSTVYRSPSPSSPEVDSLEHDLRFALGPAIFSRTEQEERLYFVQSPDSPPAVSPHHESSSSSTDVSLHFDSTDVPVHAQAATHAPASVDSTKLAEILEDLQSSLAQRIHDSN